MVTFNNRIALFYWGFSFCFVAITAAMTYVLFRDGPPPGYSLLAITAIMTAFWMGAVTLMTYAVHKPCQTVSVSQAGSVVVRWRYPFKTVVHQVPVDAVQPATLFQSKDDEGNPYFRASICLPDGTTADLAEGHDRDKCEAACARFNAARDR